MKKIAMILMLIISNAAFSQEYNVSKTELGNLCEIDRSNMNRIEVGNTNPSSYFLYVIADKLQIEASELLNFKPLEK